MIIDLHTHTTPDSDDSTLSIDELIEVSKKSGLDGICITNHDRFLSIKESISLSKTYDFLVIPGVEITTDEGHLITFGLETYIFGMHRASFVNSLVKKSNGAMILAHPYRRIFNEDQNKNTLEYEETISRALTNPTLSMVDSIDTLNGRGNYHQNQFSKEIALRSQIPGSGASDAHSVADIGTCATEFIDEIKNIQELIIALKRGRFHPIKLRND